MDDTKTARVLDAALTLCIHNGRATAEEVAAAVKVDATEVGALLAVLARRGDLRAQPGGLFARPILRGARFPGQSYASDLALLTPGQLMVGRG